MTSETVLRFTAHVLGPSATMALLSKEVTQTIRSEDATLIKLDAKPGDRFPIVMVSKRGGTANLGTVTITEVQEITWENIPEQDAYRGGFLGKDALRRALIRAGYRFKPLEEYKLYLIAFRWD